MKDHEDDAAARSPGGATLGEPADRSTLGTPVDARQIKATVRRPPAGNGAAASARLERERRPDTEVGKNRGVPEAEVFIRQLEAEIARLRAQLTAMEAHGAAKEVTTLSNAERTSINEHFESAVEELEASREALQSANGALLAVNEDLERKLEEINGINSDLLNLMNATEIGTVFLDEQLCIKRFTPPVADIFDIAAPDVGRPLAHLAHRLDSDALPVDAARVLREHVMVERELQHSISRQWFLVRLRPYRTIEGRIAGVVLTFIDITFRKKYDDHLETLNHSLEAMVTARVEQVRQLAAELIMAEHAERQRIAQILHDDLQQMLFAIRMKVGRPGSSRAEEQAERRNQTDALIAHAIEVTRTLTADLSPAVLKGEDFTAALDWLAIRMKDLHGLEVVVETRRPVYLSLELRALLCQIVRELLFNVVKHAGVDRARVTLVREERQLILRVEDEGAGFDVAVQQERGPTVQGGFGLHSVGHRLSFLGGRLETDTAPGKGTRMTLYVPLGKDALGIPPLRDLDATPDPTR